MSRYTQGRRLEYKARDLLEGFGYLVVRAAGSKGPVDLVALCPHGSMPMLVQVKKNLKISGKEWDSLVSLAEEYRSLPVIAGNEGREFVFYAIAPDKKHKKRFKMYT